MPQSLSDEDILKFDAAQAGKSHLTDNDIAKFDSVSKASPPKKTEEPQYIKPLLNYPLEALGYVTSPLAKAAGWVNEKLIDPYTGAPLRAMVGEAQNSNSSLASIVKAGAKQFGADPNLAPTNTQLAEKMGLPNRNVEILPWEKGIYAPEDRTTINPAEIGGQVIGLGTQPLTILSTAYAPEISKGASAVYQKGLEAAGKVAEHLPETFAVPGAFVGGKIAPILGGTSMEGVAAGTYLGSKIPTAPVIQATSKVGNAVGNALEAISRRLNAAPLVEEVSPIPNFPTKAELKSSLGGK